MHSAAVISRLPGSLLPRSAPFIALGAIACLILGACSPGADYPSLFPSVHDVPPPRNDTPLDRNQVQQATEDLITARDRLSAEAQGAAAKTAASSSAKPTAKSAARSAAKPAKSAAAAAAVQKPPGNRASKQAPGSEPEQAAGWETK